MSDKEQLRPFLYLRENIGRLNFVCPPSCAAEYQAVLAKMLTRLDAFFAANDLYTVVDYQAIVDNLLNQENFRFGLSYSAKDLPKFSFPEQTIQMPVTHFGQGTTTESELCHEFIHFLTTQAELQYRSRGVEHRRQTALTPDNHWQINEQAQAPNDLPVTSTVNFPLLPGFLKEGFTEFLKTYIYPPAECDYSYEPQIAMVRYINRITDGKKNWLDFLRGNWEHLGQCLGAEKFREFQVACDQYQQQFIAEENQIDGNQTTEYANDPRYLRIQDIVTRQVLRNVIDHPQQYNEEAYRHLANSIIWHAPASADGNIQPEQYQPELLSAAKALASAKIGDRAAQEKYYRNLQDFLAQTGKSAKQSTRTSHEIILPSTATPTPEPGRER